MIPCKCQNKQEYNNQNKGKEVNNKNIEQMEPNNEEMIVKKFDIATFNQKNKYGKYEFTDANGVLVKQRIDDEFPSGKVNGYTERRSYPNSPYEYYNEYDASGNIVKSSTSFYYVNTGIAKQYDLSGNVIKETNFDLGYSFTIEMLIEKMKKEYEIDLLNKYAKVVWRYVDEKHLHIPIYKVEHSIDTPVAQYKDVYLIDGSTGEMLYKTKRPFKKDPFSASEPIEAEYAKSKETTK